MSDANESECKKCHGHKAIEAATYKVFKACPECGGLGHIDWITTAMGQNSKKHNSHLLYNIAMRNTQAMIAAIKEQYMQLGQIVDIQIVFENPRKYEISNNIKGLIDVQNIKRI